jgi:hypothetical protein
MKCQLLIIVLLGLLLMPLAAEAGAADISGTWTFTVVKVMSPGTVDVTFVIKQEGEKLSGTYSGPTGEYPITGAVKGDKVVISYEVTNKSTMTVRLTGTIESPTKMAGTIEFIGGGAPSSKWTGTKKK